MLAPSDLHWQRRAIELAKQAADVGEVPVGALVVFNGEVVSEAHNASIAQLDPTGHAEIVALRRAAERLGNYRLLETTLYVSLEPCLMCAGAMVHARIQRLVFGAYDERAGAIVSQYHALDAPFLNHKIDYTGGVLKEPCAQVLSDFFKARR